MMTVDDILFMESTIKLAIRSGKPIDFPLLAKEHKKVLGIYTSEFDIESILKYIYWGLKDEKKPI